MNNFETMLANEIEEMSGINAHELFNMGLLQPVEAKKWLVMKKYFSLIDGTRTYTEIKEELSKTYGMSISMIEKLIYRDRWKYEVGSAE